MRDALPAGDAGPGLRLSVVMPAFNEESSIGRAIDEVVRHVFAVVPDAELLVVDDGSRDATAQRVREWATRDSRVRLLERRNGGHGPALLTGLAASRGARVLLLDSDAQIALDRFADTWRAGDEADAVLGVRSVRHDPRHRLWLTKAVRGLLRSRYGVPWRDANVPYKLVRREWTQRVVERAGSDAKVPSLLLAVLLARAHARVLEQVVEHRARAAGETVLKPMRLARFCLAAWAELRAFRARLDGHE